MDFTKVRIHPDYIGAVLMIFIVISEVYSNRYFLEDLFNNTTWGMLDMFVPAILASIGAAVLLFTKHGNVVRTLIVSAIIFSLLCFDSAFMDIVILGEYIHYALDTFILAVVRLACAILLLVNILIYLTKRSTNLTLVMYSLAGVFCLYIIRYLDLYRNGSSLRDIFPDVAVDFPMLLLLLFCILLARSDTVKTGTIMFTIKENYGGIRRVAVPMGVKIDRSEISRLQDIAENGMDCDSYEILMNSFYSADYKITLTRTGEGTLLKFSHLGDGTNIGIARFIVKSVLTDTGDVDNCDTVRMYGEDMFFIQLIAGGPYVPPKEKVPLKQLIGSFAKGQKDTSEENLSE